MAASCLFRSLSTIAGTSSSSGAAAITVPQFSNALQRTWAESRRFRPGYGSTSVLPRRLGLAVSGGADSMALAYLCRQWEIHQNNKSQSSDGHQNESRVTAFVVDHKARQESTQEANTVAGWLRELGITTQILPLDWTCVSISAFETHARRLRFQALGRACRDRGIETLLMGHHQDDNVETTIWRLCSGARGAGLAGISPVARIPECHGLHGVAGSGKSVTVKTPENSALEETGKPTESQSRSTAVAAGGILITRPLLAFPKSSLVQTCQQNNVPFVSDPTNFDPTLTPRNAIRSLLASNAFPRALQNESILSLIGKCQDLILDSAKASDEILRSHVRVLDLCLMSGSLTIQFSNLSECNVLMEISPQRLRELQALTLRRITELISPFEDNHFPLSSFVDFTDRTFSSGSREIREKKAFTLGGVLFHPISSEPPGGSSGDRKNATKWLLTRQPYMRRRDPVLRFDILIPAQTCKPRSEAMPTLQNEIPWTIWDNRFWIRASVLPHGEISALSRVPSHGRKEGQQGPLKFVIRPLRQSDLTLLRRLQRDVRAGIKDPNARGAHKSIEGFDVPAFFDKLARDAPGQSRFTVPVIAVEEDGADSPLALPTLDLTFPKLQSAPWKLIWEWKYKMIDLEALKVMDGVGISYSR
ncbi:PP-loop family-domain-containing protein [Aspergillus unguis]